jgi:hypothetical protein
VPSLPAEKRVALQVNLSPQAREVVDGIKDDTGIAKAEVVTRVLQWFAEQDRGVRLAILTRQGDAAAELARIKLAEMAASGTGDVSGMSLDDAVRATKVLLDRIELISTAYQEQLGVKHSDARKGIEDEHSDTSGLSGDRNERLGGGARRKGGR